MSLHIGRVKQIALANLTFRDISVTGDKGENRASVLFDTGASISFISSTLAEEIANIVAAGRSACEINRRDMNDDEIGEPCSNR